MTSSVGALDLALAATAAQPDVEQPVAQDRTFAAGPSRAELEQRANRVIVEIDRRLTATLDGILHHPALQRLEALWRAVAWLIASCDDPMVKVRLLDVRWSEIGKDLERAVDFDQSQLFELIYSQEFGTPGGEPYGMIVVDHSVVHGVNQASRTDDIAILEGLADVAAAAFCPIAFGIDPTVLALDAFDEIDLRQDLAGSLSGAPFQRWNRLRARSDSRFLAAVMPRLLVRVPHRGRDHPRLGFVYDERVSTARDMVWINGAFALAQVAMRAMAGHRWPAAIRGTVPLGEGGTVNGPVRRFLDADRPGFVARFATENAISEAQEIVLNDAGIIALRQLHHTGQAAFLNVPSVHQPPAYDSEAARMNAKMGAMLNYILCVSRFAQYIKVMVRDWVGSYKEAPECESMLRNWLQNYITGNDDPSPEMRLRYPLREASVKVTASVRKPGTFECEIALRPHYQLDQLASEFRLTTIVEPSSGR